MLTVVSDYGVRIRDLEKGGRAASEDLSGYKVVQRGDLVVNKMWARFGAYGVSEHAGIISPAYWVLRIDDHRFVPRYLHHLLRSEPYLAEIRRLSKDLPPNGFDIPWDQFRRIEVPLLARSRQQTIADFLDGETARIDALIASKRRMIGLLRERDQALVSRLVVPDGVIIARLAYFATVQSGLTVDGSRNTEGDVVTRPYLRVANVQADRVDLTSVAEVTVPRAMAARCTLRTGDVLMTEGGDLDKLGRGSVWDGQLDGCLHQNHVFAVRPRPGVLSSAYLALVTRTDHARAYFERTGVKTTNLASTNASKILSLPVPVLHFEEQLGVVNRYEAQRAPITLSISALEEQLDLLVEHRQALITAAVTGALDVGVAA
jgi:type I restriction enzyme S subunit